MSKKKNILFYYKGLRSYLLYKNIIEKYPHLFDLVIEMPTIPYSRKSNKRNFSRIIKVLLKSHEYVIMQFFVLNFFSFINSIFGKSIKDLCLDKKIEHKYFKKIDSKLISFISSLKPNWIISSTSTILSKEFLNIPKYGVINLHEAPLPEYRGSASYFWFLINQEKEVWVTAIYAEEELDAGNIICTGPKIKINTNCSVFKLWRNMFQSYKSIKNYSYPTKEGMKKLRKENISIITFKDIYNIIRIAITGDIN